MTAEDDVGFLFLFLFLFLFVVGVFSAFFTQNVVPQRANLPAVSALTAFSAMTQSRIRK